VLSGEQLPSKHSFQQALCQLHKGLDHTVLGIPYSSNYASQNDLQRANIIISQRIAQIFEGNRPLLQAISDILSATSHFAGKPAYDALLLAISRAERWVCKRAESTELACNATCSPSLHKLMNSPKELSSALATAIHKVPAIAHRVTATSSSSQGLRSAISDCIGRSTCQSEAHACILLGT